MVVKCKHHAEWHRCRGNVVQRGQCRQRRRLRAAAGRGPVPRGTAGGCFAFGQHPPQVTRRAQRCALDAQTLRGPSRVPRCAKPPLRHATPLVSAPRASNPPAALRSRLPRGPVYEMTVLPGESSEDRSAQTFAVMYSGVVCCRYNFLACFSDFGFFFRNR